MAVEYHGQCNSSWIDGDNNLVSQEIVEGRWGTAHTTFDGADTKQVRAISTQVTVCAVIG